MRKANFTSFPSKPPGKARAVFELNVGVRPQLKKNKLRRSLIRLAEQYTFFIKQQLLIKAAYIMFVGRIRK